MIKLAEGTVKNYMTTILAKLGSRDRTRAVLCAIHWQLIQGPAQDFSDDGER